MRLQIEATKKNAVHPRQAIDYKAFRQKFRKEGESELRSFEKFYAARHLIEQGCLRTFVDASLIIPTGKGTKTISIDVCGQCGNQIVVVFCETAQSSEKLLEKLKLIAPLKNIKTVLLYPFTADPNMIVQLFPEDFETGQFIIEEIPYLGDEFGGIPEDILELVTLLNNRTRVKMLLPLLREPRRKSHFRTQVNPKLVYENISSLMTHKLVDEFTEDQYDLTPIGRQIIGEYLTFLQRVKRILETQS